MDTLLILDDYSVDKTVFLVADVNISLPGQWGRVKAQVQRAGDEGYSHLAAASAAYPEEGHLLTSTSLFLPLQKGDRYRIEMEYDGDTVQCRYRLWSETDGYSDATAIGPGV